MKTYVADMADLPATNPHNAGCILLDLRELSEDVRKRAGELYVQISGPGSEEYHKNEWERWTRAGAVAELGNTDSPGWRNTARTFAAIGVPVVYDVLTQRNGVVSKVSATIAPFTHSASERQSVDLKKPLERYAFKPTEVVQDRTAGSFEIPQTITVSGVDGRGNVVGHDPARTAVIVAADAFAEPPQAGDTVMVKRVGGRDRAEPQLVQELANER